MSIQTRTVIPTLPVSDISRAREFYGGVLGLEEAGEEIADEGSLLYRVGDALLYLYERPPSGSSATACEFEVDDVAGTVRQLRERGVVFEEYDLPDQGLKTNEGVAELGGVHTAWVKDPFGNILAFGDMLQAMQRKGWGRRRDEAPSAST